MDAHVYLLALADLVVFSALERQTVRSRVRQRNRLGVDQTEDHVAWLAFGSYAFLAGGVVMNTIKEELPEQRESRLGPFVLGAGGYALFLLLLQ